jgi:hypothetical protein
MHAHKFAALMLADVAAAGLTAAALALATASQAAAQTTPANATATPTTVAKKKPAASQTKVAMTSRPPARVTVRQRSFLDPGTETKARSEHSLDYAFPPGDLGGTNGFLNDYNITFTRNPFPSCFDLAGFCR